MNLFRTLIVPDAHADLARTIAAAFGPGGDGMWTTPLSPTGEEPATHYVSTGWVPAPFAHLVPCQTWTQDEDGAWVLTASEPGDPLAVYAAMQEAGVEVTEQQIHDLFAASDVTEQPPFTAFARLGVEMVQDEEPFSSGAGLLLE